ncbi:uncharacterized protein MKK02DRAFT_39528 [Dioszegia hungarica]|uniref:Transcription factor domain-containing protein n=1 Tax=Dioszegia hungarica TaxID=4972 RepID=A0AA38HCW4_9TREE|nr:uncharacterized protein MKK02DRAFT_39528 [Dioszegia hungarica]KAI9639233.1 hypothetical protein MKK02DRAFT_39528 [Dioszegia hungarica]
MSDDEGSQEGRPAEGGATDSRPAKKPRASRALKSKVLGLETQMQQVQTSLDSVMALLQKSLGGPAAGLGLDGPSMAAQPPRQVIGPASISPRAVGPSQPFHPVHQRSFGHPISPTAATMFPPHNAPGGSSGPSSSKSLPPWDLPMRAAGPMPHGHVHPTAVPAGRHLSHGSDTRPISGNYKVQGPPSLRSPHDLAPIDAGDEGDAEPLGYSAMRSMLRFEEKARLQAEGLAGDDGTDPAGVYRAGQKRGRSDDFSPNRVAAALDPVDSGLCTEAEGHQLFKLFFENSHAFMPVFDPAVDTWYSLRQRSPFCISAIIYIAKKTQDAGFLQSDAQRRLREHVESIGRGYFFSPVVSVEILQAMIILSAWGDTSGRPGFMALSIAYDMDLHRCLPQLAKMTQPLDYVQFSSDDAKAHRSLVVGSRLWLITAKQSIETSINHSRPLCVSEADIVPHMHALLHQPYTISTDSRIVASCEHLVSQLPLHRNVLSGDQDQLDIVLRVYNEQAQSWLVRWQTYYEHRGVPSTHLLFSDLHNQMAFGSVQANSFLLRSVRTRDDLDTFSVERQRWLLNSLDHARQITQRIIMSEKDKLFYANHFSHIALASVFRIYVRLASLFPEHVDLRRTAKDLTAVADILSQFPGVSFAHKLRHVIQRARQSKILPCETRAPSPSPFANGNGNGPANGHGQGHGQPSMSNPYLPNQPYDSSNNLLDFDLFANDRMNQSQQGQGQNQPIVDLEGFIGELLALGGGQGNAAPADAANPWSDFPFFDFSNHPA